MIVALDAMGSDGGAAPLVEGAVMAAKRYDCSIILVGRKYSLHRLLRYYKYTGGRIDVEPATQVVRMSDKPQLSLQMKDSSIAVAARLVKEGRAHALVSAGNTGSTLAHTLMSWRRLKGIKRPGIATMMPTMKKPCLILDVGANVDCKPQNLVDFALLGSVYVREVLGRKNPKLGLLNVGEEPGKGNALTLETYKMLEQSHLNFIGNIEGRDIFEGKADVLVCDGFVGNVMLKVCEGVALMLKTGAKNSVKSNMLSLAGGIMLAPSLRNFKKKVDHKEYGGAPLLGLNGTCIISHGSSSPKAVMNAIRVAVESVTHGVNKHVVKELAEIKEEINQNQIREEIKHTPSSVF